MMFPMTELPRFSIGDWVEINSTCLIGQYIGRIVQIIDIDTPVTCFGRFEYTCRVMKDHDQIFWEKELTLSKVVPLMGEVFHDSGVLIARTVGEKKEEEKEDEEPKVIWV